jgi:hypothetical protein
MAQKRRGRPPGKRKEREPVIAARIPDDLLKSLEGLAKQHGQTFSAQTLSAEVNRALQSWVKRHEIPQLHNSALGHTISLLADRIERLTGQSWMDDPPTREVVREHVERLVTRLLSPLAGPVTVPAEVKEDAGVLLALLTHVIPGPGSRRLAGTVIVDDPDLAMLTNDLARKWGTGPANVETRPALVARRKQDEKAWADAVRVGTAASFTDYIQRFRFGRHVTDARKRLAALEEQRGRK